MYVNLPKKSDQIFAPLYLFVFVNGNKDETTSFSQILLNLNFLLVEYVFNLSA
jgi:hypothetical protein